MGKLLPKLKRPGWPRRFAGLWILVVTALLCGGAFYRGLGGDLVVAGQIFAISLVGFSALAWLTFDAVKIWRAVDYPWVLASFIAVICALAGLAELSWKREMQSNQAWYREAVLDLSGYFRFLHDFYCRGQSYTDLPDFQRRICGAIPDTVTGLDRLAASLVEPGYYADYHNMAPVLPFINSLLDNDTIKTQYGGRLAGAENARKADLLAKTEDEAHQRSLSSFITTTGIRYWYFVVAFFVGLRLSRTTAELLQTRRVPSLPPPPEYT